VENSDFDKSLSLLTQEHHAILIDTNLKKVIDFNTLEVTDEEYDMNIANNMYLVQKEYNDIQTKKNHLNEIFRVSRNRKNVVI